MREQARALYRKSRLWAVPCCRRFFWRICCWGEVRQANFSVPRMRPNTFYQSHLTLHTIMAESRALNRMGANRAGIRINNNT